MLRRLILLFGFLVAACASAPAPAERPITVLISIDGLRPDYLERGVTPTLSRLAAEGVRASMRPSFPSKTFPNHYTLVTGLRPDRHGIVDNNMEDPAIPGVAFSMSNKAAVTDRRWWDGAEPIWVAAERAGIRSATMFWPGSEAPIRGVRPTFWRAFDQKLTSDARVDQVLTWLDEPFDRRPGFATLYFDIVDIAGHNHGPDSPQLNAAVAEADAAMGRLVAGLARRKLPANLVVVADHGMAATSPDRVAFLDDLAPVDSFRALGWGAMVTLYPAPGQGREVERRLVGRHPHFTCWKKNSIPRRFQYGRNPRVAPIICLPETGWLVATREMAKRSTFAGGAHGFDPFSPEMAAIFIASGPAFRRGARPPEFDNVDVYPLLARLLGVRPAPNDGDLYELGPTLAH